MCPELEVMRKMLCFWDNRACFCSVLVFLFQIDRQDLYVLCQIMAIVKQVLFFLLSDQPYCCMKYEMPFSLRYTSHVVRT
jgi:hypothetical protein